MGEVCVVLLVDENTLRLAIGDPKFSDVHARLTQEISQ